MRHERGAGARWIMALLASAIWFGGCGGEPTTRSDAGDSCDDGGCCAEGDEGCACRTTGRECNAGLVCGDGTCSACPEGAEGCACAFSDPRCGDGLVCEAGTCSACAPGSLGCSCGAGESCDGEGVCAGGDCRAPSCEALRLTGECLAERECADSATGPMCGACSAGYCEEGDGTCRTEPPEGCDPSTCVPGDPGSIASVCELEQRVCEGEVGAAACGACLEGFMENPVTRACEDSCGGIACAAAEMPEYDSLGNCTCVDRVCDTTAGEAELPDGTCATCSVTCGLRTGETGAIHPMTDALERCVCETTMDHYWDVDLGQAAPCDEDGDGWVTSNAFSAVESLDPAIALNARCTLQRVDRVELLNDYGQSELVWSCNEGLVRSPTDVCLTGTTPITLVESGRNDSDALLATDTTSPVYGTRNLTAFQLNALTRACVDATADFNEAGGADVAETQTIPASGASNSVRLGAFTHFVEQHTNRFEPAATLGAYGRLVIAERPRFGAGFPLGYGAGAGAWWAECHRGRDARFDRSLSAPGFDFAQWSCDTATGTCPVEDLPAGATLGAHGASDFTTWGSEPWRGMHHHSQFQCVLVGSTGALHERPASDFDAATGHLTLNDCAADAPIPGPAGAPIPITCGVRGATDGAVGFAATRYAPTATLDVVNSLGVTESLAVPEVRGCVDESPWNALCEPWGMDVIPFYGADDGNFGRLVCGCGGGEVDYYVDSDGDGFGDPATTLMSCVHPGAGYTDVSLATDCDDTRIDVFPGATGDVPDADMIDLNCDGFDGDLSDLGRYVFVSPGGDDTAGGTRDAPRRTLPGGLSGAGASRDIVVVEEGVYTGGVRLLDGVGVYGGYRWDARDPMDPTDDTWTRDPAYLTEIRSDIPDLVTHSVVGLHAESITAPTTLQHLRVLAGTPGLPRMEDGISVYGIRAVDAGGLRLEHVTVIAGDGSRGTRPDREATGAEGGNASGRSGGVNSECSGANGGYGGQGGHNKTCWVRSCSGNPGTNGGGAVSSCRGAGGAGATADRLARTGGDGTSCSATVVAPAGSLGAPASIAADGLGSVSGGYWIPSDGGLGAPGGTGRGGGAGGGGGGSRGCSTGQGGNGRGGGAGGCGGAGGLGGGGGGASFALFAVRSTGLSYVACELRSSAGGVGAEGGLGGFGGAGGSGIRARMTATACSAAAGGVSADGTPGGDGGQGGSGIGGSSIAVYACGSPVTSDPTGTSVLTPGTAGVGGPSADSGFAAASRFDPTCP